MKEETIPIKLKISSWRILMREKIKTKKSLGVLADEAILKIYDNKSNGAERNRLKNKTA